MIYQAEDFEIRQTVQTSGGYPCVEVVPPGSMPFFEMTAGHALVLAAKLEAAAKKAMAS